MRSGRVRPGLAALGCALLLVAPLRPVAATWSDAEFVRAPVQLSSPDCTATGLYRASASAALLAGTVQGTRIADGASTAGVSIGPRADAASLTSPLTTAAAGRTPSVGGTALPLVLTAGGSWGQTASTSGTGSSSAGVTGTAPLGTVGVSDLLTRSPAATALLPGLSGVALDVGAPAASASLDACAAGWGATDALVRTSSIGALTLRFADTGLTAGLTGMRADAADAATALTSAAASASAPVGRAISDALVAALGRVLATGTTAGAGAGTATVSPSTSGIAGSVAGRWTSGSATVDSDAGTAAVDLLPLVGTAADTEVLTTASAASAATALGQALQLQAAATATVTAGARERAPVAVSATANVLTAAAAATGTPVATVTATASGTAADWIAGTVRATVVVQALTATAVQSGLADAVAAQLGAMPTVGTAITTGYLTPARAAAPDTALAGRATTATALLQTHLAALPAVLGVTAAQQARTAAASWTGALPSGVSTRSAVRIRVTDASGTRADLFVGNVSVGPDAPLTG